VVGDPSRSTKDHATRKGNAKKPDMQAAAQARWGVLLKEDEADAVGCGLCNGPKSLRLKQTGERPPQGRDRKVSSDA
jgi:hypothetical protein